MMRERERMMREEGGLSAIMGLSTLNPSSSGVLSSEISLLISQENEKCSVGRKVGELSPKRIIKC